MFEFSVALGDLDGDSDLDLVTADTRNGSLSVRLNGGTAGSGGLRVVTVTQQFTYEPVFNQLTSATDELGRQTLYEIDPSTGNLLSITRVVGEVGGPDDVIIRYTYTPQGLLDTETDPLGRVTDYDYDAQGRLIATTLARGTPDEAVRRSEYDAAGNLTATIDENGRRTERAYDVLNRLVRERDPLGNETLFAYDAAGNLVTQTDARGGTTRREYDALGRATKVIDAQGGENRLSYDAAGNLNVVVDPLGHETRSRYDARGRLVESIDPAGGRTLFRYDRDNNLGLVTDPAGNQTGFVFDARNRLIREIDPLGKVIVYEYDPADNRTARTDRNGQRTEYQYDELDRRITESWVGTDQVIRYTYDQAGNLASVADSFSALAYTYDNRNRVLTVDNGGTPGAPHVVLAYTYDPAGNVLSVVDTINGAPGATTAHSYDVLNRLTRISQTGGSVRDKRVDLTYNEIGQFASITRFADLGGTQLIAGSTYDYDPLHRLTDLVHANVTSTVAFHHLTYDAAGRITSIADLDGTTAYGYDERDQLTLADHASPGNPDESYAYDANGNRVASSRHGTGYVTGPGNRLLSDGRFDYAYDDEGNLIRRTERATGQVREFHWNHRNRLVAVVDRDSSDTQTQRVEFTYDVLNRRTSQTVKRAVDEVMTSFVYDRDNLLLDFVDADGAGPGQPVLEQRYVHGREVDQVVAQEDAAGDVLWLLGDHLGTIRDLVTSSGLVRDHLTYDSFGNVVAHTDAEMVSRFQFTGREFDAATGLAYYRARYYDLETGRFLSQDPTRFVAGDANLYRYVANYPIGRTDPTGLVECTPNTTFWDFFVERFLQTNRALPGFLAPGIAPGLSITSLFGRAAAQAAGGVTGGEFVLQVLFGSAGTPLGPGGTAVRLLPALLRTIGTAFVLAGFSFEVGVAIGSAAAAFGDYLACRSFLEQMQACELDDPEESVPTPVEPPQPLPIEEILQSMP